MRGVSVGILHLHSCGSGGESDQSAGRLVADSRTGGVQEVVDAADEPRTLGRVGIADLTRERGGEVKGGREREGEGGRGRKGREEGGRGRKGEGGGRGRKGREEGGRREGGREREGEGGMERRSD